MSEFLHQGFLQVYPVKDNTRMIRIKIQYCLKISYSCKLGGHVPDSLGNKLLILVLRKPFSIPSPLTEYICLPQACLLELVYCPYHFYFTYETS